MAEQHPAHRDRVCGGLTGEKQPSPQDQAFMDGVKPQVEKKLGRQLDTFTLLTYKTQVVAGINYFAKVDIGEDDVVHLRVYRRLDQSVSLTDMQYPKARDHPITYF